MKLLVSSQSLVKPSARWSLYFFLKIDAYKHQMKGARSLSVKIFGCFHSVTCIICLHVQINDSFHHCYAKDLHNQFYLFHMCTDTGVIITHAFIFLLASDPFVLVDSCAACCCASELCSIVHCDLLLQWHHCSCDAYCSCYSIVLLEYLVRLAG